ncbi:MAG TPA: hypothetical protein VK153_00945 [Candidatus Paceibacterota bacterium]|nr:hypothetical protein [Candidatus Paceibacterota bacterium]
MKPGFGRIQTSFLTNHYWAEYLGFPSSLVNYIAVFYINSTGVDVFRKRNNATVTSTTISLPADNELETFCANAGATLYYTAGVPNVVNFTSIQNNYNDQCFSNNLYTIVFTQSLSGNNLSIFKYWFGESVFDMIGTHPDAKLDITSPYSPDHNNDMVHASLLYFNSGWNGYKYWMVATPLPQDLGVNQVYYENPCVYVSNNKLDWVTFPGSTNPVASYIEEYGWNSDPAIFYLNNKIYIIYRVNLASSGDNLYMVETNDGINYSSPVLFKSGTGVAGSNTMISPSIVFNNGKYYLFVHEVAEGATYFDTRILVRWESTTFNGSYSNRTVCTYDISRSLINSSKANTKLDHSDIKIKNGIMHGLAFSSGSHAAAGLYYMKSYNNGVNWIVSYGSIIKLWNLASDQAIKFDWQQYKAGFIFNDQSQKLEMVYSGVNPNLVPSYSLGYSDVFNGSELLSNDERGHKYYLKNFTTQMTLANARSSNYIFADDFIRADTTDGLYTSSSGGTWQNVGTQRMKILNNTAIGTSTTNRQLAELGTNSHTGWLIANSNNSSDNIIHIKYYNTNNNVTIAGGRIIIYCLNGSGGVSKSIQTQVPLTQAGVDIEYKWWTDGDNIKVWMNGYKIADFSLSSLNYIPVGELANFTGSTKICLYDINAQVTYKKILIKAN